MAYVLTGCALSFVKDDTLKALEKKYEGIYLCLTEMDIGNEDTMKSGTKVRLYFQSGTNSIKVYGYPIESPREQAIGKNIMYLFDTDFPDNKFEESVFDKKLAEHLKKIQ